MAFRLKLVPDNTKIDFFRWQWLTVGASAVAVVVSILATILMGLNYGIDFRGGTTIRTESTTAFDIGEWGLGFMTTSLELGCDCLGEIRYLDAVLHNSKGEPYTITNAICIHEEDNAVLWKHVDHDIGAEVRRMRRLTISFHVTVANYEYLVYWRLYQDGNIECEVRATGIMVTTVMARM